MFLSDPEWQENALLHYKAFAEKGLSRDFREEASFKVALLYKFEKENSKCVQHLMTFLRNFRKGDLYEEGQALLIELFPVVIHEYVQQGRYMEALVLAKQNRKLFLKNWVDISLLSDLANSYNSLGIYDEASRIYLYLITLSSEDKKEQYYLPVIQAAYDHGSYFVVEDYADQYGFHYPDGEHYIDILEIRIESLLASHKYVDAIKLLPADVPATESFSMLAATLYFHEDDFNSVIRTLDRQIEISSEKTDRYTFLLAESYYQTKQFKEAEKFFSSIKSDSIHYDQALYRRAEFFTKQNDKKAALKFYKELAETGKSKLWIGLATKAIEYSAIVD
jgi:tetratricopeptide (TPR) repeat protein